MVGGTAVGLYAFLNRDKRHGGLSPAERSHLNRTFGYAGAGLTITAVTAKILHNAGWSYRLMTMNPWVVMGGSLALSLVTMYATISTPQENTVLKHTSWIAFNVTQAGVLAPMFFLNPAVLSRAALYTVGVVGALAYVGATANETKYLYLGGPLLAGVTVVALSSLAPLILPVGTRGLALAENISLYGGLAVFSAFILYDTQKVLAAARMSEMQGTKPDAVAQCIGLELDAINIFVRMATMLANNNGNRKR